MATAERVHPNPFRTRKLSSPAPMVLRWERRGRVGRCRPIITRPTGPTIPHFWGASGLLAFLEAMVETEASSPSAVSSVRRRTSVTGGGFPDSPGHIGAFLETQGVGGDGGVLAFGGVAREAPTIGDGRNDDPTVRLSVVNERCELRRSCPEKSQILQAKNNAVCGDNRWTLGTQVDKVDDDCAEKCGDTGLQTGIVYGADKR